MEYEYTYDVTSDKAAGPFVTPVWASGGELRVEGIYL